MELLQNLLSTFAGLEAVQGYDGTPNVASMPSELSVCCEVVCFVFNSIAQFHKDLVPAFPYAAS